MFAKLVSTLALALPLVSALTVNTPNGATTGGTVTLAWTATSTDPAYFTFELVNTAFHNTFAIANNVQASLGTITIQLPQVPVGDGYTLEAVATNDVNTVYASSGDFAVGAQTTPTSTMTSTASTSATGSSASSAPLSSSTAPTSSLSSASSSSSSAAATNFNTGAASSLKSTIGASFGAGPLAVVVLSAMAGAAIVF
ncbi:hypothetical protein F5I97DRAFT_1830185 [Phlebopus sp. FC_14]|nr:hypothetical protein F5I97DRAFT_1830185 [Phlebopus sp. FC_14]